MPTPTAGEGGLRYNQFHTTALCSPTRAALLTGRNHTSAWARSPRPRPLPRADGNAAQRVAPLAEMLRLNGYSTAAFGKSHETAAWEVSPSGPTDRWPTRSGFDKFYGFIGGETNQWRRRHLRGHEPRRGAEGPELPPHDDMTNQAIEWTRAEVADAGQAVLHVLRPRRHARPAPRARKEWIAKYKGKFDQGWDKLREEHLARQIAARGRS